MSRKGFIIFHRHGERIPMKLMKGPGIKTDLEEITLWNQFLPQMNRLEKLKRILPINQHKNNDLIPKDLKHEPFGRLTDKGMDNLFKKGISCSEMFPEIKKINFNKIKVFSTNYQRTQLSVQELLNGMLNLVDYNANHQIPINVRDIKICSLAYYDGKPEVAFQLIASIQNTDKFKAIENNVNAVKVKEVLKKAIPLIIGPKGFDWMAAYDYYACRKAHDIIIQDHILEYYDTVRQHLVDRYSVYFSHNEKIINFIYPMIRDINDQLNEFDSNKDSASSMTIFSCHDVNILALLYALKSIIITNKDQPFWPHYGDTLAFEFTDDSNKVNVFYNEKPLEMTLDSNNSRPYITKKELKDLIHISASFVI